MPKRPVPTPTVGTLRITKWIHAVGSRQFGIKLQLASGTKDRKTYQEIMDAIDYLIRRERDDLIDDLIQRRRTPMEIRQIHRGAKDNEIPRVVSVHPLKKELEDWAPKARNRKTGNPLSPASIKEYQNAIRQLMKHAPDGATVRDLPAIFTKYRDWCQSPPTRYRPKQALNCKVMLLAFIRSTEGKRSPLYGMISDIPTGTYTPATKTYLTLADAVAIREALPPQAAAIWWACCMTGFRYPSEFVNTPWHIDGKTVVLASDHLGEGRTIPLLDASITPPALSESRYRVHFRQVASRIDGSLRPYMARDVFQRVITAALDDHYRMREYLGRDDDFASEQGFTKSDTHYQQHVITSALIEADRKKLVKYLAKELKKKATITIKDDAADTLKTADQ